VIDGKLVTSWYVSIHCVSDIGLTMSLSAAVLLQFTTHVFREESVHLFVGGRGESAMETIDRALVNIYRPNLLIITRISPAVAKELDTLQPIQYLLQY